VSADGRAASPRGDLDELHRAIDELERGLAHHAELSPERRQAVLAGRAAAIAAAREEVADDTTLALAFRIGGERYAIPLPELAAVLDARGLHALAGAPRWLLGAVVSRARLVPVLDLRQMLRLEGGGMSDLTSVVVVDGGAEPFGLAVEAIDGHVHVPRAALAPAAAAAGPVRHVTPDRVAVLDPRALGSSRSGRCSWRRAASRSRRSAPGSCTSSTDPAPRVS
jgi:purine-binding chemotaxis protein CheW